MDVDQLLMKETNQSTINSDDNKDISSKQQHARGANHNESMSDHRTADSSEHDDNNDNDDDDDDDSDESGSESSSHSSSGSSSTSSSSSGSSEYLRLRNLTAQVELNSNTM